MAELEYRVLERMHLDSPARCVSSWALPGFRAHSAVSVSMGKGQSFVGGRESSQGLVENGKEGGPPVPIVPQRGVRGQCALSVV